MKLSIIIPVYNTEDYLAACLDSVIYDNLHDYEIIIVNDGSTDSSPVIASTVTINLHQMLLLRYLTNYKVNMIYVYLICSK